MFKAIFFDLSGVLYDGTRVIPGAVAAIQQAQQSHLQVRFVTNTSRMTSRQVLLGLQNMGFELTADQLFSAPVAAKALALANNWRPYCLVHRNLKDEFADLNQENPDAVIIGDAEQDFCYENLNYAFQLCRAGAPLVGIGRNRYFKLDGKLHLDAGPFISAIEYAASVQAIIMGKPSADFFNQISVSTGVKNDEILMVGDDVFGDIEGALKSGMHACLVKTGKYQTGDENLIAGQFSCADSVTQAVELALG
ncbi:TIGR01458 family HAD-type hydrolase [Thalassomonas viridans]|uniref:Haloacid dehalogenase-like hydrolase domain-containing protein 2 n=1 Tax=Thalassomonas viridans TaxID=137584 RepID=A0AAF0CDQ6_9GAMM|nr:TIGR01458 family HAD-type hydrolase [Thalassomonas viridans]WDE08760.1 TIGR01458 family HAD-type hydrolase [Thalassomonas viridans]